MNISSISSTSTNNSIVRIKNIDNEIKLLEKQKAKVHEQISKIKEKKIPNNVKEELIKPLTDQIRMLEQQIQQKQAEKMNRDEGHNSKAKNSKQKSDIHKVNKDRVELSSDMDNLVKLDLTYSKMKITRKVKTKIGGESRILKIEAKLDRGRGNLKAAEKKEERASECDTKINEVNQNMGKKFKKVINNLSNGKEIKDTDKNEENSHTIEENS